MTASSAPRPASQHPVAVPAPFSLISSERLWDIYAAILRCRALAERGGELVRAGIPAGSLHAALGLEGLYAGILVGLQSTDLLLPEPDDMLAAFLRGTSINALFASLAPPVRVPRRKPSPAKKSGALPLAPSPAAQLHLANGAALALKPHKGNPLVVAFCGPGAAPDEAWQQALEFAGAHTLPILFVCHAQARDAASLAKAEARFDQLHSLAHAARVPAINVDAHDAVAVHRVASESVSRARLRRGATLIACLAHPTLHMLVPNASGHKSKPDQPAHLLPEPGDAIPAMEMYLGRKALFDPARKAQILEAFARQLDRATRALIH